MDKETLRALKGSIKKWESIIRGKEIDKGTDNCALCKLFCSDDEMCTNNGTHCPIYDRTTYTGCEGSPYDEWSEHQSDCHEACAPDGSKIECGVCERIAKSELKFLKSLLPKKKEMRS
jgi:hypothetical protein